MPGFFTWVLGVRLSSPLLHGKHSINGAIFPAWKAEDFNDHQPLLPFPATCCSYSTHNSYEQPFIMVWFFKGIYRKSPSLYKKSAVLSEPFLPSSHSSRAKDQWFLFSENSSFYSLMGSWRWHSAFLSGLSTLVLNKKKKLSFSLCCFICRRCLWGCQLSQTHEAITTCWQDYEVLVVFVLTDNCGLYSRSILAWFQLFLPACPTLKVCLLASLHFPLFFLFHQSWYLKNSERILLLIFIIFIFFINTTCHAMCY